MIQAVTPCILYRNWSESYSRQAPVRSQEVCCTIHAVSNTKPYNIGAGKAGKQAKDKILSNDKNMLKFWSAFGWNVIILYIIWKLGLLIHKLIDDLVTYTQSWWQIQIMPETEIYHGLRQLWNKRNNEDKCYVSEFYVMIRNLFSV